MTENIDRKAIQTVAANLFKEFGVNSETIVVAICDCIEEYHRQQQQYRDNQSSNK